LRFDDRLATVLTQPIGSTHDRAVRWRQLVDLVARSGGEGDRALLERALSVIRDDIEVVGDQMRAAAVRAISGRPVPLALMLAFAKDKLSVSAPLFLAARMSHTAADVIRGAASDELLALLDRLHPDVGWQGRTTEIEPEVPSIEDLVARIEGFRRSRTHELSSTNEPAGMTSEKQNSLNLRTLATVPTDSLEADDSNNHADVANGPLAHSASGGANASHYAAQATGQRSEGSALFVWESNPQGEIEWVEGIPRGGLIGRSLTESTQTIDKAVVQAIKRRAPFRDCSINLGDSGTVGGHWSFGGSPVFDPQDGRFVGYRGVARRGFPESVPIKDSTRIDRPLENEALRELIHEIKTPLNAIIGFAEIIDGQYFGPAHRHYRLRAAQIVANARLLLQASDDLDFIARFQSQDPDEISAVWVSDFASNIVEQLIARAARRSVALEIRDTVPAGGGARIAAATAERLVQRFGDSLIGAASSGDVLTGSLELEGGYFSLCLARPTLIAKIEADQLLNPEFSADGGQESNLGIGFSLRLVNGLAELTGSRLEIGPEQLCLKLPLYPSD
jgi:hypothetical protein